MSYALFLLIFIVPPMLLFGWLTRRLITRRFLLAVAALLVLCVVYTTPWDNYLVATGVWSYSKSLVIGPTFGYVPVEEYVFFVLQTLMGAFFTLWLWRRLYRTDWDD